MIEIVYQAKAGDGVKKVGMKRTNSFFRTPQDAISEAFALKEKMDSRYKNEIQWDYDFSITGPTDKLRILKGYLGGNRKSNSFYLEIQAIEQEKAIHLDSPKKPKKLTTKEQQVMKKVKKYLASK